MLCERACKHACSHVHIIMHTHIHTYYNYEILLHTHMQMHVHGSTNPLTGTYTHIAHPQLLGATVRISIFMTIIHTYEAKYLGVENVQIFV